MQATLQPILFDILLHQIQQIGHREKDDTDPLHDRGDPKTDREMRFSHSRWAQQQNVFPMSHKAGRCQFAELCLIESWLKREVELLKRLDEREARLACF